MVNRDQRKTIIHVEYWWGQGECYTKNLGEQNNYLLGGQMPSPIKTLDVCPGIIIFT